MLGRENWVIRFCALWGFALSAVGVQAGVLLRPASVNQFFVEPGRSATLRWTCEGGVLSSPVAARLLDAAGRPTTVAVDVRPDGPRIAASLSLGQGFWEIEFPATGQRFGIVALPAWSGPKDPFFAIDGALSWLVHDDDVREGLVRGAARSGIGMIRERLTWGGVHKAADRWDWDSGQRFDRLRRTYARHGVQVLEMAHDGPAWMGRVKVYPENLVAAADSWAAIARHWKHTWGAVEVWNEPDIFFGGDLPADQYVPLAKAIAYRLQSTGQEVVVVGGAVAQCNREYLDNAAACGLLDAIDVFSFHSYDMAPAIEGLVAKYRDWLAANRRSEMPLWITECGRPWKIGPERPPAAQDAASAADIVMKAVEARATGIARHFPFVYPYYEEDANNFGMMDRRGSPLRAMAGYVQMVRALAHRRFMGDLPCGANGLLRARVFGDGKQCVAVLYTGKPEATVSVRLEGKVLCVESMTGGPVALGRDGSVAVADGLVYVWLDRAQPGAITPAKWAATHAGAAVAPAKDAPTQPGLVGGSAAQAARVDRKQLSPIVLCHAYDAQHVTPFSEGYRLKQTPAGRLAFRVRAFNLSSAVREVQLALQAPRAVVVAEPLRRTVSIPAGGRADVQWQLDPAHAFAASGHVDVAVVATEGGEGSRSLDRTVVRLHGEASLSAVLDRCRQTKPLPIGEPGRWTPLAAALGRMVIDRSDEAAWRMTVTFGAAQGPGNPKQGDRWAYPSLPLPEDVSLGEARGMIVRARCRGESQVRLFVYEGHSNVGYFTDRAVIPADGRWHVAKIPFARFSHCAATTMDPNGRLDLDAVRRISVGLNTTKSQATLEVSDLFVYGGEQ